MHKQYWRVVITSTDGYEHDYEENFFMVARTRTGAIRAAKREFWQRLCSPSLWSISQITAEPTGKRPGLCANCHELSPPIHLTT